MASFLVFLATLGATSGFVAPLSTTTHQLRQNAAATTTTSSTELYNHKLVLVRHGESEWNDLNIFTGWADASLNAKGLEEASEGGKYLKEAGFTFDVAYTSVLKRAIKTLWIVLEELDLMYIPIVSSCIDELNCVIYIWPNINHGEMIPIFTCQYYASIISPTY